jgi:two-component system cell cycle sensor histidine kinase/response regulator CckA
MGRTTRRIGDLIESVCATFTLVIGALAVTGWLTGQLQLASIADGLPPAKANAALAFVLLGAALLLRAGSYDGRRAGVGTGLAIAAGCIGLATLAEYATGVNLGIDELIVVDASGVGRDPGRMAFLMTVAISLAAGSIVLHGRAGSAGLLRWLLALGAFTAGYFSLLGLSFGALELATAFGLGPEIGLPAALSALALGLAGLACCHTPSPTSILLASTPGARIARVVVVAGMVGLPAVGWFSRLGEDTGLFTREFGAVVMVATSGVVVAIVGLWAGTWADRFQRAEKLTLEHLAQMEGRYRGLLEAAPDAMVVVNGAGDIVLLNLQAEKQFGYHRDELVGQPVTNIIPEGFAERLIADDLRSAADALAQQIGTGIELIARRKDGSEFPIEIMLSPLKSAEGILVTAAIRDITERKRLEAQLSQSQRLEAVGQLAGGIAHDFNNLLTAIRGYSEFARRGLGEDDDRRSDIDEVIVNADRAAALIRQLLAFSRRQILQPQVLDPAAIVEGIVPMLRRLIGEQVELTSHTAPGLGGVKVDPSQLEQVIVNLAVNARDAMPDGGKLTIELSNFEFDAPYVAAHAAAVPGPYVLLVVSDTGVGMDVETRVRVFEPFFTTKEPGKGTGMGLATVYGIIKQSGGFIYVYSEPGQGTTFRIYLPRVAEERPAAVAETPAARPSSSGTETILLVEDEPAVRDFARRTLEEQGYIVLQAASGADALSIIASHAGPIALLVTDVVMPGLQGYQVAEQLAAARPELRVLYVSGFTENSMIHRGVPDHGGAFLAKPFSSDGLGEAVRRVLDGQAG